MDEVTGELRRFAEEDGGVLFHCRPRGPRGVETWADGWVELGRLDPLDLQDLVRALRAPAPVEARRGWRWALLGTLYVLLVGLAPPLVLVAGPSLSKSTWAIWAVPLVPLVLFLALALAFGRRR